MGGFLKHSAATESSVSSVSALRGSNESRITTFVSDSTRVMLLPISCRHNKLASTSSASGCGLCVWHVAFNDGADSWLADELASDGGDPRARRRAAVSAVMWEGSLNIEVTTATSGSGSQNSTYACAKRPQAFASW